MTDECRAWASLSDRLALGDVLSEQERTFLRQHADECPTCSVEAKVWSTLGLALAEPSVLTARHHAPLANAGLTGGVSTRRGPLSSLRRQPRLAVAVALLGAVAAAAVATLSSPISPRTTSLGPALSGRRSGAVAPAAPANVRVALVAGAAQINGQDASAGQYLSSGDVLDVASGQTCVLVPPGVTVCAEEHTQLVLERLNGGARRLKLTSGHVVARLEQQPIGASFGFETIAGTVVAHGTVFSVQARGDDVSLRVHEGTVVRSDGLRKSTFSAPSAVVLSHKQPAAAAASVSSTDARLIDLSRYFGDRSTSALVVNGSPGGTVKLDEAYLGGTPLSALIAPGSYQLVYSSADRPPTVERLTVLDGARLSRSYEPTRPAPPVSADIAPPSSARPVAEAAALLGQARELRSNGRFAEAAASYRRLVREHGSSAEARAALVSLGELQLSQLGDAKGALGSFDAYLRGGGALRQEAEYGRIRALRALGRRADERAATAAFLGKYPASAQAARLRKETETQPR